MHVVTALCPHSNIVAKLSVTFVTEAHCSGPLMRRAWSNAEHRKAATRRDLWVGL